MANQTAIVAEYDAGPEVSSKGGWLRLHRNENLFLERDPMLSGGVQSVLQSPLFYPDETASALRQALASLYHVSIANIFVGNGSDEVLALALHHLRKRFDAFYTWKTGYGMYPILGRRFEYDVRRVDEQTMYERASSAKGLFIIDSPNAITGERSARDSLLGLARNSGCFLLWDNCYGEFCGDTPIGCPLPPNVIFVRTFSKFFGLAGLRVGYCIADADIISSLMKAKDIFNVNAVAQGMALEVLRRRDEFVQYAEEMSTYRTRLVRFLQQSGFSVREPNGNFVFTSHATLDAKNIMEGLREHCIQVRWYGQDALTINWLRITVPPPWE